MVACFRRQVVPAGVGGLKFVFNRTKKGSAAHEEHLTKVVVQIRNDDGSFFTENDEEIGVQATGGPLKPQSWSTDRISRHGSMSSRSSIFGSR
jgi:hypothetical protein